MSKEKLDIEIGTKEEALWHKVVNNTRQRIQQTEKQLKVERVVLKAAEKELQKAKRAKN